MDTRTHAGTRLLLGTSLLAACAAGPERASLAETAAPTRSASTVAASPLARAIDAHIDAGKERLVGWRRHFHEHPELGNREFETAKFVAARLTEMGLEPRTGVARTGVVAVIEGGRPGRVVALRADMDALPVKEEVDLPFASKATGTFEGKTVPVMHACGHDAHTAMLLSAAEALVAVRAELPGQVVLLFQPAEESVPIEEQPAGAELMVREGVLDDLQVDAIFGLHVFAGVETGRIALKPGPLLAAADRFEIVVKGRQTHGSKPWAGVDPIMVASEIVGALQTIVSRTQDIVKEPVVVTVGQFESGVRNNIIPDTARLVGTIRTFDDAMRADVHARVEQLAQGIAASHGATATVRIEQGYPVTSNDAGLAAAMRPTLERVAPGRVFDATKITGAEDFSFYARKVPGLFVLLGITPAVQLKTADSNHSPRFYLDEAALPVGAKALANLAADWLAANPR
ncbi:MAG: amidohydrolase [Planctomycetes bacterium]|nr:amidohydrolase [Planctomycetota bacterium]